MVHVWVIEEEDLFEKNKFIPMHQIDKFFFTEGQALDRLSKFKKYTIIKREFRISKYVREEK